MLLMDWILQPNRLGPPMVGLLFYLDGHHLFTFLLLQQEWCSGLLVYHVGVGVEEHACLLMAFYMAIRLVALCMAHIASQSLDGAILMTSGLPRLAFQCN